jgi:5'-nucleotidase
MKRLFSSVAMALVMFTAVSCYTDSAVERNNPTPFFEEKGVLITPGPAKSTAKSQTPNTFTAAKPMPAQKTSSSDGVNILDVVNEKPASKTAKAANAQKIEDAAKNATPGSASATPKGKLTHTVQKGDTLWSIAKDYYGDGREYKKIIDANPGLDAAKMKVGQEIVIP